MIWNNLFSKKNLQEILWFYTHFHHFIRKRFFKKSTHLLSEIHNKFIKFSLIEKHQFKTSISHLLLSQQLLSFFIMTCNVKSVEFQTTHLLRSTVNRRVLLLLIDASVEAEKAVIAWNINIEEQLFHWVSN